MNQDTFIDNSATKVHKNICRNIGRDGQARMVHVNTKLSQYDRPKVFENLSNYSKRVGNFAHFKNTISFYSKYRINEDGFMYPVIKSLKKLVDTEMEENDDEYTTKLSEVSVDPRMTIGQSLNNYFVSKGLKLTERKNYERII